MNEGSRADADKAANPIRLPVDHGPKGKIRLANAKLITDLDPKAAKQTALNHGTLIRKSVGHGQHRAGQAEYCRSADKPDRPPLGQP